MSFSVIQTTAKGRLLLARAQTGTTINFTRIKMGDGTMTGQAIDNMSDVISQKVNLSITELKTLPGGKAKVQAKFTNQGLGTGFYWREIAVFATDPDNPATELMYCYGNAYNLADYIPAQGSQILEKIISVLTIISNATNVTATINESLVYASKNDLEILVNQINEIDNKTVANKFQTAGGSATVITLTEIVLADGNSKTFVIAANNNGAPTTINGKSLYKPGTTIAPILVAGKAVTVWYNASGNCFYCNSIDADTVNGHTVDKDVPNNAVFTDTVYTHPNTAGNKHIPAGGSAGQVLKYVADGTASWGTDNDTVYTHPSTHPATILASGPLPSGVVAASGSDYAALRLRNIKLGTAVPTTADIGLGEIYLRYS